VEFRPDGTFTELAIGRGDAPEPSAAGRWSAAGVLTAAGSTGSASGGRVVTAGPDRLEIVWE
jgi:hypothetical protein